MRRTFWSEAETPIPIDFGLQSTGALLDDPASLEVSLLIDGALQLPKNALERWFESIRYLYEGFSMAPSAPDPSDPWAWLHSCVRQIRLYAGRFEKAPKQYSAALAAALIIKARHDQDASDDESLVRAYAYRAAELLTSRMIGT
jgi:hypothetical protein